MKKLILRLFIIYLPLLLIFGSVTITSVYAYDNTNLSNEIDNVETIYTYTYNDIIYESNISEDDAWANAMNSNMAQGLLTEEQAIDEYSIFSRRYIQQRTFQTDNNQNDLTDNSKTHVEGYLKWETSTGEQLPLKNIRVDLYNKYTIGSSCLMTTYSNDDGYYSFYLDNNEYSIFVRIFPDSYTFQIARDWLFTPITCYYIDSDVREYNPYQKLIYIGVNIDYNPASMKNNSFYMSQAFIIAQNFAYEMGMVTNKFLHVIYPFKNTEIAFCLDKYSGIAKEYFSDFDILMHEYGHFVEGVLGTYGSDLVEIILYGPRHPQDTDHFSDKKDKQFAMELTWSEAWATVFAQMAQEYYHDEYFLKLNGEDNPIYKIQSYGDYYDINFDIQKYTPNYDSCEAQEEAVIASLWDMFDDDKNDYTNQKKNESHDELSLGYKEWWNITTKYQQQTLTNFVNIVDEYYPKYRNQIAIILGHHQIAPSSFKIDNIDEVSRDVVPILSWKVNGSADHPNNLFKIVVKNIANETTLVIDIVNLNASYNEIFTYSSSLEDWQAFYDSLNPGNLTLYVSVMGYNSESPISGPYYSNCEEINLTIEGIHVCHYNIVTRYSKTKHKASCECGNFVYSPHAVKAGTIGRYKNCIACGELIDTGSTIIEVGPFNNTNVLRTLNGSYILPNGIIVLVDEDIVSYLNGTLIFSGKKDEVV